MAHEHIIDPSNRSATVKMSGAVTGAEAAEAIESTYQDPNWHAGFALIGDLTGVTEAVLEQEDFPKFVGIHKKYEAAAPRVEIILVRRQLDRTMAGVYKLYMSTAKHKVHVCASLAEASELL